MKILYRQSQNDILLNNLGIQKCYFKHLITDEDASSITSKLHHHTGFEIHIITEGYQEYESGSSLFRAEKGTFLIIPPLLEHRVVSTAPHTAKYSLTFESTPKLIASLTLLTPDQCITGTLSNRISETIRHITEEYAHKKQNSAPLICNAIFEILVLFSRQMGLKEETAASNTYDEDFRLTLAKQYIQDNIKAALSVSDVADYCHISTKQLTRIFQKFENTTPLKYLQTQRITHIEMLLAEDTLSLKEISEQMNFTNEYYFNTFFTRHAGMTPGAYRKMLRQ